MTRSYDRIGYKFENYQKYRCGRLFLEYQCEHLGEIELKDSKGYSIWLCHECAKVFCSLNVEQ